MIRIISGIYKGRYLEIPKSKNTRPTMDKVRQAIFSAMKDKSVNSIILDLFAGSGAYGIEAISRGGKIAYLNDKDKTTFSSIVRNVKSLNNSDSFVISNLDYRLFLKKYSVIKFDLVFLDPPYSFKINENIINDLKEHKQLNENALIVSEQNIKNNEINGFKLKEYKYGSKFVGLYYYIGDENE